MDDQKKQRLDQQEIKQPSNKTSVWLQIGALFWVLLMNKVLCPLHWYFLDLKPLHIHKIQIRLKKI